MPSNYLQVAFRKFRREKLYSLINLAGLSIAIACCIILAVYLRGELTYDQHHENHDRVYRIVGEYNIQGVVNSYATTPWVLAPMLAEEFDEIETFVTPIQSMSSLYRHEEDAFYWTVYTANENMFDVFTFDVIYGDINTALLDGASLAVSESFAQRYWGDTNPIGEIVTNEVGNPLTIDLVFADPPQNSHMKYDVILSSNRPGVNIPSDLTTRRDHLWIPIRTYSYLLMPADFDPSDFEQMAQGFYERHMAEEGRRTNSSARFWLEPLTEVHYNSDTNLDQPRGNTVYLYALAIVALFILLIACINYINLATARSARHAKEVGMRKILGASTTALRTQFVLESTLMTLASMLIGLILAELLLSLSPISELFGKTLEFSLREEPIILVWLLGFSLLIGIFTGLYPALYLSSWSPISGLVNYSSNDKTSLYFRQLLVLVQFTAAIAVVACTLLMFGQMKFVLDKSLGFEKENRIVIEMIGRDLLLKTSIIEEELSQHPGILGVTSSEFALGEPLPLVMFSAETEGGSMTDNVVEILEVEQDFQEVMGMTLLQGRSFSENIRSDTNTAHIVNQSFVDLMGWTTNPIGKRIGLVIDEGQRELRNSGRIIGVVEDFHFKSLHQSVDPLVVRLQDDISASEENPGSVFDTRFMTVNISGDQIPETIRFIEDRFAEFDPEHPFQFKFLDESLDQLYQSEVNLMRLLGWFAGICIFIACLGLFGLSSYTTEQRAKEIGIRKTLGASSSQILLLLSKNSLSLALAGSLIGCLIAYITIDAWLSNFAYRAEMSSTAFVIATLVALAVAYTTVAIQAYKTARSDPVDALRYE